LAISAIGFCEKKAINSFQSEYIFEGIFKHLEEKYRDDPKLAKCMIDHFKKNKVAEKIYLIGEIFNPKINLSEDIKTHEDKAKLKCKIVLFLKTPIGICIVSLILLSIIIFCCCILKKYCCKAKN
jgi:hypothetical protein